MKWKFDKNVARNFDYIADTSIPKYRIIIYQTLNIITKKFNKESKILEIGCANGNTLQLLKDHNYTNVIGIDNSSEMLKVCNERGFYNVGIHDDFPTKYGTFDIIIANWTLHFITDKEKRIDYITEIYNHLNDGGIFILSEKIIGDENDYLTFKKNNFLTEEDIQSKKTSLKDVLVPFTESLYMKIFNNLGFKCETIDKTFCFRTYKLTK